MTNAQHAAFYAFLLGVNLSNLVAAVTQARWPLATYLFILTVFCAIATFVFTVELKGDQKPTPTTNLNEKV